MTKREEQWNWMAEDIEAYLKHFQRRPSKYRVEDRDMHTWLKYNKKLLNQGRMPEEHIGRFRQLLELCEQYKRVNQYAYKQISPEPKQR